MTTSLIIDSDTHIDETDQTWEHVGDESIRPRSGSFDQASAPGDYWAIDGYKVHKAKRLAANTRTTKETRELLDIDARLRDMDALGVDVQVIYPTIFNRNPARRPEVELELARSYNRWIAERTALAGGRLRWVCVPPLSDVAASISELRFAKDNGACGVLKKGDREAGHLVWHDYFFGVYEEAERLDMPICFHQGTAQVLLADSSGKSPETDFLDQKAPAINGVASLLARDVMRLFPTLRFGCLEVGASWVALVDHMYRRRIANRVDRGDVEARPIGNIFAENRIWTTCEVDEDFPAMLRFIDEDHLLVGSDYGHNDPSQDHWFVAKLRSLVDEGVLSPGAVHRILSDNPRRFYGL